MLQLGQIDRADDRPSYRQIAGMLREAIESNRLASGERLPSEAELIEHFGVARMTVRQAVQELVGKDWWSPSTAAECSSARVRQSDD